MSKSRDALVTRPFRSIVNTAIAGLSAWIVAMLLAPSCGASQVQDDQTPDPQIEGRLWNISDQDFRFRLRRSRGKTWTREHVLAPDEFYTVRRPEDGGRDDLDGISTHPGRIGEGHLIVQYPEYGGQRRQRIKAEDVNKNLVPFWFYVTDSGGHGRLIQRDSLQKAQEFQQKLKEQEPRTPEQLERFKQGLRANHALMPR